jgi:hypothetical protein
MVAMTADSDQLPAILLTETTATVTGGDRHTRPAALSNSSPQTSDPHHHRRYDIGFISTGEFTHPRVYPVVCLGNDTALPEKSHAHGIAFSGVSPASKPQGVGLSSAIWLLETKRCQHKTHDSGDIDGLPAGQHKIG